MHEPSAWDVALPAAAPQPPATAPAMLSAQIHPGGSFHFHQPGSEVTVAPSGAAGPGQPSGGAASPYV
eukprot:10435818-Alexandrium_andersonii.AAC.1